jgi:hypothetical protein
MLDLPLQTTLFVMRISIQLGHHFMSTVCCWAYVTLDSVLGLLLFWHITLTAK